MRQLRGFGERACYRGCFLSIGNFDGVHRGHRVILAGLVDRARAAGVPAVVMTFEPHPLQLLSPHSFPPRLTVAAQKVRYLAEAGVDVVIGYPTDWKLLNLSAAEFFQRFVVDECAARGLVEGSNFFFGKARSGTVETLRDLCAARRMSLDVVTPATVEGQTVSSSLIRQALSGGDVARANAMLGRAYSLLGSVQSGAQRGRTVGFPTANLHQVETLVPADGVYAGRFQTDRGDWPTAIHVGPNPTFGDGERKIEAHLLDFTGDLYGRAAELFFIERLRESRRFASAEELQQQVLKDVARTREIVDG